MAFQIVPDVPRPAMQALRPLTAASMAALCGAVALHWLLLTPAEDRLFQAQAAYEEARRQAVALKEQRKTQERVRDMESGLERVWAALPAEQEFNSVAIAISKLAMSVDVSVPGMTHHHKRGEDGLPGKASLVFRATGRYEDISTFLHKLETQEPYLVIESLEASRARGAKEQRRGAVQFNVKLVTFLKGNGAPGPEQVS